jgi:hypothetical protein
VNVVDVAEDDVTVSVVPEVLIPSILDVFVRLGVQLWSCIIDYNSRVVNKLLIIIRCLPHFNYHQLIFHCSIVHQAIHALTRSPH